MSISLRFCVSVLLFCATSLNLLGGRSLPKEHVALFILGDSMFDAGNNNYINTTFQANYCPYGVTFFKYPTGRFSDGRLIPDFIAEYAKLPLIPPYLQPDNHQFTYGVNFASAGAGALAETGQGVAIDLRTQVSHFKNVEKLLRQKLGDVEAKILLSQAVYLITIGANDYLRFLTSSVSQSNEEYVGMVIGNLSDAIKEINKKGGRKFGILALGDLGFVPSMKVSGTVLSQLHNAALSEVLKELNIQLEGFRYAKQDINITVAEILNNPEIFGDKEVAIACCGSGPYRRNFNCGGKRGEWKEYEVCSDPSEYLFFDAVHLTEKTNQQIAEFLWSGTPNFTGPSIKTKKACCGSGELKEANCGTKDRSGCSNPSEYLFWDGVHHTRKVNSDLALLMWRGNSTIIYPQNFRDLFAGDFDPMDRLIVIVLR